MNPKLNSTISVVKISDTILEFFKSNTRSQVRIKVNDDDILNIVSALDGTKTVDELAQFFNVNIESLKTLLAFMEKNGLLDVSEPKTDFAQYKKFRRNIHFIEEYAESHEDLLKMWQSITGATVLIVGLGAVGTWTAANLAQCGVGKIILMDGDTVDVTNLHRQYGFCSADIGKKKVDVLARRLAEFNSQLEIIKSYNFLNENNLSEFDNLPINLIINCADKPNVDTTSLFIGEYAMRRAIPHIIGGGYNLHLSLIGQTVLPGKSACVKCFEKTLEEENKIDSSKVKKLAVKNRKVGSFAPMCSIIASFIGMEAVKILSDKIPPANINRRGEFNIFDMNITYKNYERRNDCEWCGKDGKYFRA